MGVKFFTKLFKVSLRPQVHKTRIKNPIFIFPSMVLYNNHSMYYQNDSYRDGLDPAKVENHMSQKEGKYALDS